MGPSPRYATHSPSSLPFTDEFDVQTDDDESGTEDDGGMVDGESGKRVDSDIASKIGPGDFEILRVVGKGAFGKVFQVRKKECNHCDGENGGDGIYAMKVMRKDTIIKKNHVDYMRAERDILTKVVHPFIVQLRYSFQVQTQIFSS